MKIEINLGEKYADEGYLDQIITDTVKDEIITAILRKIRDRVDTEVTKLILDSVEKQVGSVIRNELARQVEIGVIYVQGKETTIAEHVKTTFMTDSSWRSLANVICDLAARHSKDLKAQYDLAFATQIVNNLNQAGLLKEDAGKLLLSPINAN